MFFHSLFNFLLEKGVFIVLCLDLESFASNTLYRRVEICRLRLLRSSRVPSNSISPRNLRQLSSFTIQSQLNLQSQQKSRKKNLVFCARLANELSAWCEILWLACSTNVRRVALVYLWSCLSKNLSSNFARGFLQLCGFFLKVLIKYPQHFRWALVER